jgi:hypothetical protein
MNSEDYLFSCCGIVCTPFMAKALGHSIENMHVHSSNVDERRLVTSESSSALDLRPNVVFFIDDGGISYDCICDARLHIFGMPCV